MAVVCPWVLEQTFGDQMPFLGSTSCELGMDSGIWKPLPIRAVRLTEILVIFRLTNRTETRPN